MNKPTVFKRSDSPYWWYSWIAETKDTHGNVHKRRFRKSTREWELLISDYPQNEAQRIVMLRLHLIDESVTPDQASLSWLRDEIILRTKTEGLRPSTVKEYRIACDHLIEMLGSSFPLAKIARFHANELQKHLISRGDTPATVNKVCRHVAAAFQRLVDDEFLEKNPFKKYTRLRESPRGPRHLTREQIIRLFEIVDATEKEEFKHLLRISMFTGIRRNEVLLIRRDEIDLERDRVKVMNVKIHDQRKRWIKIPDAARESFAWFLNHRDGDMPLKVCHPSTYSHWVKTMLREAGLQESLHLHSLRHSFITLAGEKGVDLWRLQMHVGHASSRTTEGYFHPDADLGKSIDIGIDLKRDKTGKKRDKTP